MRKPAGKEGRKTQGQHLESLARRGHERAFELLSGPERPPALEYLWDWALELDAGRTYGEERIPQATSYSDILAWATLTDREVEWFEVTALRQLDTALMLGRPPDEERII